VSTTSVLKMSTIHQQDPADGEDESFDDGVAALVAGLKHPLFTKQYAVTLNIQPTRFVNKRQWKNYNHDQQRAILGRMEASIRKRTPSIKLLELHYEVAPTVNNIHFHALYEMSAIWVSELQVQWNRMVGTIVTPHTKHDLANKWRHLDIFPIKNGNKQWLEYIRKDVDVAK